MGKKKTAAVISGAPAGSAAFLREHIHPDSTFVLCADSGYTLCLAAGITPDLVIGDFDSSPPPVQGCAAVRLPRDKDDSDTFFCVKKAVQLGYREIEIYNAFGARADHSWANILCLDYCRRAGAACRITDEHNRMYTVEHSAVLKRGAYAFFSVFAFLGRAQGVSIQNARFEVSNIDLAPADQFGLSNAFKNGDVGISVKKGVLFIIESKD